MSTYRGAAKQIVVGRVDGREIEVNHADLLSVVRDRRAAHRQQEHVHRVHVLAAHTRGNARVILVTDLKITQRLIVNAHKKMARINCFYPESASLQNYQYAVTPNEVILILFHENMLDVQNVAIFIT